LNLTRTLLEDFILQSKAIGMDLEPFIDYKLLLIENVFQSRIHETISSSRFGKGLEIAEKDCVGRVRELSENADIVVLDSLGALTKTKNCVGSEALSKFDAIYSILAKSGCTSLILMDKRAHNQHQGFADYLVFGKIEMKFKEGLSNGKFVRHLSVAKMRATNLSGENVFFELTSSGIKMECHDP